MKFRRYVSSPFTSVTCARLQHVTIENRRRNRKSKSVFVFDCTKRVVDEFLGYDTLVPGAADGESISTATRNRGGSAEKWRAAFAPAFSQADRRECTLSLTHTLIHTHSPTHSSCRCGIRPKYTWKTAVNLLLMAWSALLISVFFFNQIVQRTETSFVRMGELEHPYPPTKIMWSPDKSQNSPDLLATTGELPYKLSLLLICTLS